MSAIRLRTTAKGIEVRVDDETLISDEPVSLMTPSTYTYLTLDEAQELVDGLTAAIRDGRMWLKAEKKAGLRP